MPDAPSNLPFADMPNPGPMPPVPPPAPTLDMAPRPPMPPAPPIPPMRPVATPPQDLFAEVDRPAPPAAPKVMPLQAQTPEPSRSGSGRTVLWIVVVLIVLAGIAGASWYGYQFWKKGSAPVSDVVMTPTSTVPTPDLPILPPPAQIPSITVDQLGVEAVTTSVNIVPLPAPVTEAPLNTNIPLPTAVSSDGLLIPTFPQGAASGSVSTPEIVSTSVMAVSSTQQVVTQNAQTDTDGDGLVDVREQELGTDSTKADTDSDGIDDGKEVLMYGTNPLNPDTDGDGFNDGVEVRNGFNPRGTGKCSHTDCHL